MASARRLRPSYRLQLRPGFGFAEAAALAPYLAELGIGTLYLSPILEARRGSTHGYDVTDPGRIRGEIGGARGFDALVRACRRHGLEILLDIVPNHMAASPENPWWRDVLERGPESRYAKWFDIDWEGRGGDARLLLPILGDDLDAVIARRELRLETDEDGPHLRYHDARFPLAPGSWRRGSRLRDVLKRQHYRLDFWKLASTEASYRRFFNVADLVALRVERPEVFDARHALVLRLVREGKVGALRVDHVDGLRDPSAYLVRLRRSVGPATPILVEKILERGERLPDRWPVDGTTGYDFLDAVSGCFVDPAGAKALEGVWTRFTGAREDFAAVAFRKKHQVARMHFVGEIRALAAELAALSGVEIRDAERAIAALLAAFPAYRTYARSASLSRHDRRLVDRAVREARRRLPDLPRNALAALSRILRGGVRAAGAHAFVLSWQQLTAPVHAKGVEDSAFYAHAPLAALNEVGGSPVVPRDGVASFHRAMRRRLRESPGALDATSTHDTKRGEDARARLYALSELPRAWETLLRRWRGLNAAHRTKGRGTESPTRAEEALFYQTLLSAWPADGAPGVAFRKRIREYLVKAAREAKEETSWLHPDAEHEKALTAFSDRALRPSGRNPFVDDLEAFRVAIARLGAWTSLSQVLVKVAAPGVPDTYQGSETWDLRLVDPDNRRPVDFARRKRLLDLLSARGAADRGALCRDLVDRWETGEIKLYVLKRALGLRASREALFSEGDYLPLRVSPPRARNAVAFARRQAGAWAVVVAPRLVARFCVNGRPPTGAAVWKDATLSLPPGAPEAFADVFTGRIVETERSGRGRRLPLSAVLSEFPVALLREVPA